MSSSNFAFFVSYFSSEVSSGEWMVAALNSASSCLVSFSSSNLAFLVCYFSWVVWWGVWLVAPDTTSSAAAASATT